jgi:O-antigen/teichoic acid export membrane protein
MGRVTKLWSWTRTLALTGGAQAAIQLFTFGSGLLIIRTLTSEQYAFYTIANAALGMMTVLTDSGIGASVYAQAGLVWQEPSRLGAVVATAIRLRQRLATLVLLVTLPLTYYLLWHQGAGWVGAALITASILPIFFSTITGQLYETVPRLCQRLLALQRIQLGSNVARLLAVALIVPLWPMAAVASIVTVVPQWVANRRMRRLAQRDADLTSGRDAEIRSRLWRQARRTIPGAIYYALSAQLNIWLISLFGHSKAVAAVGALTRLAMLLVAMSSVFSVVAVPRFARLQADQAALIVRRFWQLLAGIGMASLIPVLLLSTFPSAALAIIGPQYKGLTDEAVLMGLSALAATLSGSAYTLAAARGIVAPPLLAIPFYIVLQAALIASLPIQTVTGVIEVSLLASLGQGVFQCGYFLWHMYRSRPAVVGISGV